MFRPLQPVAEIAQRRKVLRREADAIEEGDLALRRAARLLPGNHAPEFGDRMICSKLLDFPLDARLRRIFDEYVGTQQDVAVQFRLARAVSADSVDVNPGDRKSTRLNSSH